MLGEVTADPIYIEHWLAWKGRATRLVIEALAFGAALTATWALLLLSSGSPWQTVVMLARWASTPSLVIGNAAVGLLLTLRLASAPEVSESGAGLALGIALLALSFGAVTADVRDQSSDSVSNWAVLLPLLGSGAFFGAFLTNFPRRLEPYEWRHLTRLAGRAGSAPRAAPCTPRLRSRGSRARGPAWCAPGPGFLSRSGCERAPRGLRRGRGPG